VDLARLGKQWLLSGGGRRGFASATQEVQTKLAYPRRQDRGLRQLCYLYARGLGGSQKTRFLHSFSHFDICCGGLYRSFKI
jgi:hypothetical protein